MKTLEFITFRLNPHHDDGRMGRLINDSVKEANATSKVVEFRGIPRLCIFANNDISPGEEILFSYNKGEHGYFPWRNILNVS